MCEQWHVSLRDIRAVYDPEMHIAMLQDSSRHHFYAKCLLKHQEDLKDKVLQCETRTGLYFWTSVVSLVAACCCIYRTSHHQPTAPECIFPGRLWCHMCHITLVQVAVAVGAGIGIMSAMALVHGKLGQVHAVEATGSVA